MVRSIAASDKRLNFSLKASFVDFKIISFLCVCRKIVSARR